MKISTVNRYPLTGGRAVPETQAWINAAGTMGDRVYVAYSPKTNKHVSQCQASMLARISLDEVGDDSLKDDDGWRLELPHFLEDCTATEVTAFGQQIPVHDMGDEVAEQLTKRLAVNEDVRLARKVSDWSTVGYEVAADRSVAPLHFFTTASLGWIQGQLGVEYDISDRFRASAVIDSEGEDPFHEAEWQDKTLCINGITILISRPTKRCPMPGIHQETGENLHDIPRVYKQLPEQMGRKAVFGVYGYPILEVSRVGTISVGDEVVLNHS